MGTKVQISASTYQKVYDLVTDLASPRSPHRVSIDLYQRAQTIKGELDEGKTVEEKLQQVFRVNDGASSSDT